ncbi:MAG: hypothetical protein QM722_15075 [Piscinibacter sp.]
MADSPNTKPRLPLYLGALEVLQLHVDSLVKLADLSERVAMGGPLPTHHELRDQWMTAVLFRRVLDEASQ